MRSFDYLSEAILRQKTSCKKPSSNWGAAQRGYQSERGPLRTYLFGIGRKRAAEWWRKQPTRSEPRASLAMFCTAESDSLVGDAFARLPREYQTLLWLREVEGQSYAELADILDIPVGSVRSRLFTYEKFGTARLKHERSEYEVRRNSGTCLPTLRWSTDPARCGGTPWDMRVVPGSPARLRRHGRGVASRRQPCPS